MASVFCQSAVTYAALNVVPLMAVLATMGKQMRFPLEIGIAGIGSGVCLGTVAVLYDLSLLRIQHLIPQCGVPLFALIDSYSPFWLAVISDYAVVRYIHNRRQRRVRGGLSPFRLGCRAALADYPEHRRRDDSAVPARFCRWCKSFIPSTAVLNLFVLSMILLYPLSRMR